MTKRVFLIYWMQKVLSVWLAAGIALQCPALADPVPVQLEADSRVWKLDQTQFWLADDLPASATEAEIIAGDFADRFNSPDAAVPNLSGYDKVIWGKLRIANPDDQRAAITLVAKYPQLDHIDWFVVSEAGEVERVSSGQFVPRDPSQPANRFPTVSTLVAAGETKDIFFRIQSDTVIILPLRIYRTSVLAGRSAAELMVFGLLIGCLAAMAALGLISFFASRHWSSLWFSVFCLASIGYILTGSGIDKGYLWPARTGDYLFFLFVFNGIAMAATALFVDRFLKTKSNAPTLFKLLRLQTGFALLTCFTTPLPTFVNLIAFVVTMAIGPMIILIGVTDLWRRRAPGAGLVLLSWIPSQMGAFWIFLRALNIAPYSDLNHYTLPVFSTLTAIAFIWALHRQNAESAHRASHDLLTGLQNRFGFEQTVARASGQRERPLAVMQIDLDGFKAINDTYGHAAGDFVLQDVSARLRKTCLPSATPFRNGGDEFIVLCQKRTRKSDVEALAQSIIQAIAEPITWRGHMLNVGASVGIAFPTSSGGHVYRALEEADAALYAAKQNGKGCVVLAPSPDPAPLATAAA